MAARDVLPSDADYDYTARALPVTELMDLPQFDDLLDDEQRLIQKKPERGEGTEDRARQRRGISAGLLFEPRVSARGGKHHVSPH